MHLKSSDDFFTLFEIVCNSLYKSMFGLFGKPVFVSFEQLWNTMYMSILPNGESSCLKPPFHQFLKSICNMSIWYVG